MGFLPPGFGIDEYEEAVRKQLVGANLQPPIYNSVSAAGTIVSYAPSSGRYPVLVIAQGATDTDGNYIDLQALDTNGTWRTFMRIRFIANTSFGIGFPAMRLDKVRVGGTTYNVKPGDGTTATLRAYAGGSGTWECMLWVGER